MVKGVGGPGWGSGAAVGFNLDSLLKLTDTRARNVKMTLMHYLCKVGVGRYTGVCCCTEGLMGRGD